MKIVLLFLVIVVILAHPVDRIFEQFKENGPGCQVMVLQNGAVVFQKGYGLRNLEEGLTMNDKNIVFSIASITKQFTGIAIAMLIEEGKLSEEDSIKKFLPNVPTFGQDIRIHHLLHHTSGYISYDMIQIMNDKDLDLWNEVDSMEVIERGPHLNSPPNVKMSYTNTGFFLLGKIIEKVTNVTLSKYFEDNIFKPLGMSDTFLMDNHRKIIKRVAHAYSNQKGTFVRDIRLYDTGVKGSAGIWSTLEDMAKYDANFYNNKLGRGGPALIQRILRTRPLNNGEMNDYAYGLFVMKINGSNVITHSGSISGYRGDMLRFPDKKLTVNLLCNVDSVNPQEYSQKVASVFLNVKISLDISKTEIDFLPRGTGDLSKGNFNKDVSEYAGIYFSKEIKGVLEFKEAGSVLRLDLKTFAFPLFFKVNQDDSFAGVEYPFIFGKFSRDANGKIVGKVFNFADRLTNLRYVKVAKKPDCFN